MHRGLSQNRAIHADTALQRKHPVKDTLFKSSDTVNLIPPPTNGAISMAKKRPIPASPRRLHSHPRSWWLEHYHSWQSSGLSKSAYCAERSVIHVDPGD